MATVYQSLLRYAIVERDRLLRFQDIPRPWLALLNLLSTSQAGEAFTISQTPPQADIAVEAPAGRFVRVCNVRCCRSYHPAGRHENFFRCCWVLFLIADRAGSFREERELSTFVLGPCERSSLPPSLTDPPSPAVDSEYWKDEKEKLCKGVPDELSVEILEADLPTYLVGWCYQPQPEDTVHKCPVSSVDQKHEERDERSDVVDSRGDGCESRKDILFIDQIVLPSSPAVSTKHRSKTVKGFLPLRRESSTSVSIF